MNVWGIRFKTPKSVLFWNSFRCICTTIAYFVILNF